MDDDKQIVKRERQRRVVLDVTEKEYDIIQQKMLLAGTNNFSLYARKMLLDGVVVRTDFSALRELTSELGHIGNNINQIAYRANSTRFVKTEDIQQLLKNQNEMRKLINKQVNKVLTQLSEK